MRRRREPSRLIVLLLLVLRRFGSTPLYYDSDTYTDCFQGTPGWYHLAATCIFPLTQFERDYATAIQLCGAVNHSIGYRETNWLIATQLLELLRNRVELRTVFWTGLRMDDNSTEIGVEAEEAAEGAAAVSAFTSVFNPLWAVGQPPQSVSDGCIALDLRDSSSFGWRLLPCSTNLPVLCQNYACLPDTFRCVDNSRCVPTTFVGDGVDDCLDGSDETVGGAPTPSGRRQKTFDWPMRVSDGGVLSPSTLRYGRGECTHRWTVLSPQNFHFLVAIKWLTPSSSTLIVLEGKERNETIQMTSRNTTSSVFRLSSSSFVATALNTDTRRQEFQIFYQQISGSECDLSASNRAVFWSSRVGVTCDYRFATSSVTSYVALLVHESVSSSRPQVATVHFLNTTVILPSLLSKRLLVVPSSHVAVRVNSTWPLDDTRLDVQFFELAMGSPSPLSIFLADRQLDVEWYAKSDEPAMSGDFRQLSISMILARDAETHNVSTWRIDKFRKTCNEDNVQLISSNTSSFISNAALNLTTVGPSTLIFHQSAEPFEFRATYSNRHTDDVISTTWLYDETSTRITVEPETTVTSTATTTTTTVPGNRTVCKLPPVYNGYIEKVSPDLSYSPGARLTVVCLEGFEFVADDNNTELVCQPSGSWASSSGEPIVAVHCSGVQCPQETPVETDLRMSPDTWDRDYGSVRRYPPTGRLPFGPFCVCGDDERLKNGWKCYNTNGHGIPDACIGPTADDVEFTMENGDVPPLLIPNGTWLTMRCLVCPTMSTRVMCHNGLYLDYGNFECTCSEYPGFVDPCAPHGTYKQYSGSYNCVCDDGYKFVNGTCQDIDECAEGSDWCDRDLPATSPTICVNLEPGFRCECPPGWQLYNNEPRWQRIDRNLIAGYSCVESLCDTQTMVNYTEYGLIGHWPPDMTPFFRSGSTTPAEYIENLCDSEAECVVPIHYTCDGTTLSGPDKDIVAKCSLEELKGLDYHGDADFHVFYVTDVSCPKSEQTMIGRNKIFCNSNANWEMLPKCIYESCSNITQFIRWPLKIVGLSEPNGGEFTLESEIEVDCDGGFRLEGERVMRCTRAEGGDMQWYPDSLPVCIPATTSMSTSSTGFTSPRHFSWTTTWPPPRVTSSSAGHPIRDDDDVVIENSAVYEETNWLEHKEKWMMSPEWKWTSSDTCLVHESTTSSDSFIVTSTPIHLNSSDVELVLDVVSPANARVQLAIFTSSAANFVPPVSEFRPVINTTSSGSVLVKLRNLKTFVSLHVVSSGHTLICAIATRERRCREIDVAGVHLASSTPFASRRRLTATCGRRSNDVTTINGVCDARHGWIIQRTPPCLCDPRPPCPPPAPSRQHDVFGVCTLNSCSNGRCQQADGYFTCICNDLFVPDVDATTGVSYCRPNHCLLTSEVRNSGYNCTTGADDVTVKCVGGQHEHGAFCQYSGTLVNSSYVYIQGNEVHRGSGSIAFATNVCESAAVVYAIPSVVCHANPSPSRDICSMCSGADLCEFDQPPYQDGAWCYCYNGDFGRNCRATKFCFSDGGYQCQNGGTCDSVNRVCHCLPDFTGARCETLLITDQCTVDEKNCGHGTCRRENDYLYCNCELGYLKDANGSCTIHADICDLNNYCQQESRCQRDAYDGAQMCNCSSTDGWTGHYCEIQPHTDTCHVCDNEAQCFPSFTGGVRCKCALGWGGDHCDRKLNDCDFSPCLNGGQCQSWKYADASHNLIETYNCTCPQHYSGTACEVYSAPTCDDEIHCENGGSCEFDNEGTAICVCPPQFYGARCENNCSNVCKYNSNGCTSPSSSSSNSAANVTCTCIDGYTLDPVSGDCVVVNDVCKANLLVCENNGTCNHETQTCDCPNPFSGRYCDTNNDKCREVSCLNGATCLSPSGVCQCPPNYTGATCENRLDACVGITCQNGGTCNPNNGTCTCLPGTTGEHCEHLGQPCTIRINGVETNYCLNGGRCNVTASGATCDCTGTDYTGRRCESNAISFNFNLVFNGLDYSPDIVSSRVTNSTIQEFTLCAFVQYNHPTAETETLASLVAVENDVSLRPLAPYLSFRGYGDSAQQMVFDNNGFFICYGNRRCSRADSNPSDWKSIPISANTWHHFCVVSPISSATAPNYTAYLDGVQVVSGQLAEKFNPGEYAYIYLAPSNITRDEQQRRFEGMISIVQLYSIRLTESQIGQLAFDCNTTLSDPTSILNNNATVPIKWNGGFTRVSSSNPGVYVDPAGICRSVKCMFGRQVKGVNNYNSTFPCSKDRIAPTVLRCPSTIYRNTTEDYTQVEWPEEAIAFFDNIGVVKIDVNYMNGQQFGIGITAIRYVAFDAAGNSAECTFDVIVSQTACPTRVTVVGGTVSWVLPEPVGPFARRAARVTCTDARYPSDEPRFYTCDVMGSFRYGGWADENELSYYLPACGDTVNALQSANGTAVGRGSCAELYTRLRDVIWSTAECDVIKSCNLTITPPCDSRDVLFSAVDDDDDVNQTLALQYTFSTGNASESIGNALATALGVTFGVTTMTSSVRCPVTHPLPETDGNRTFCVSCAAGTFADESRSKCVECAVDTYRNPDSPTQLACTPCPPNFTTGTVTGAVGDHQCYKVCAMGEFERRGACLPCPEGTFGDRTGLRKCTCCPFDSSTYGEGKTSDAECTKTCPPGQEMVRSSDSLAPTCVACRRGFYKPGERGPCAQCPRGLSTLNTASDSLSSCSVLECIDVNTRRNADNVTVTPSTPYSELCVACEQGQFQNTTNASSCMPCAELADDVVEVPVTCQSTCSADIPVDGCNCQLQRRDSGDGGVTIVTRNCLPTVTPNHRGSKNTIAIVLSLVFGVLMLVAVAVAFFFRKQIVAWFRKSDTIPSSDNQHVAPSHWDRPASTPESSRRRRLGRLQRRPEHQHQEQPDDVTVCPSIPRPNLRIVTSPKELDELPPLPPTTSSFFRPPSSGVTGRSLGFEANGSPLTPPRAQQADSDDSSLDSDFF